MVASTSEQINIVTLGLLGPESTVFACHHERILPGQNPEGPQITQKNSDRTTVTVPKLWGAVGIMFTDRVNVRQLTTSS